MMRTRHSSRVFEEIERERIGEGETRVVALADGPRDDADPPTPTASPFR